MREALELTLYASPTRPETADAGSRTWDLWSELFTHHDVREQKMGPSVILGRMQGRGATLAHMKSVEAIGLDLEHRSEAEVSALLARLAPFEFVLYTTFSHGEAIDDRFRMILPLAHPIAPSDFPEAWARVQSFVGFASDEKTKNPNRHFYLPAHPPYPKRPPEAFRNTGRWVDPAELPPAPAHRPAPRAPASIEDVREWADRIRQRMMSLSAKLAFTPLAKRIACGEELAPAAERHQAILDATWWISRNYPAVPVEAVEALFAPSLAATPGTNETSADVRRAFEGALLRQENHKVVALREQADGNPYSGEDILRIATAQGCSPDDLRRRWIVQVDTTFFLLQESGFYTRGYSYHEARPAAARVLTRAPLRLNEPTANGFRRRPIGELVEDYGVQAQRIVADLAAQTTSYDGTSGTLREAVCPLRPIAPLEDAVIDRWLRALGGDQADDLLDWIATVPRLERANSALYLAGSANAGKSLLPTGLARLWTEGSPSKFDAAVGRYNEGLANCPLVLVDEALKIRYDGQPASAVLRTAVSETRRSYSRKYKAEATMTGAIRLVLTSNNDFLLQDEDARGASDRAAIAQRFLYVEVGPGAAMTLEEARAAGADIQRDWIEGDRIAAHALWLTQTRASRSDGRFLVQGRETSMHRQLATGGSSWNRWVCEWLVRYLDNPTLADAKRDGLVRVGGGELLANAQAIVDGWQLYLPIRVDPDTSRIGEALAALSHDKVHRSWAGRRRSYYRIDPNHLVDWSERHGVGDAEHILGMVQRKLESRDGIGVVPTRPERASKFDATRQGET